MWRLFSLDSHYLKPVCRKPDTFQRNATADTHIQNQNYFIPRLLEGVFVSTNQK